MLLQLRSDMFRDMVEVASPTNDEPIALYDATLTFDDWLTMLLR